MSNTVEIGAEVRTKLGPGSSGARSRDHGTGRRLSDVQLPGGGYAAGEACARADRVRSRFCFSIRATTLRLPMTTATELRASGR